MGSILAHNPNFLFLFPMVTTENESPEQFANRLYIEAFDRLGSKGRASEAAKWCIATLLRQSSDYGMLIHHPSGLRLTTFYSKALEAAHKNS